MELIWNEAKNAIKQRISEHNHKIWIEPLELSGYKSGVVVLSSPNVLSKKRVQNNFGEIIEEEIKKALGNDCKVLIEVSGSIDTKQPKTPDVNGASVIGSMSEVLSWDNQLSLPVSGTQRPTGRMLRKDFTFDSFVVGENSDFAYTATLALASNRSADQNYLYLLSKNGMGKTHLSQAMGHYILSQYPSDRVFYMTAEDFANEMVYAFKSKAVDDFKEKYRRHCDVLLLEDIHFLTGKDRTQAELAFALDYLLEAKKKIIFTSCYLPTDIPKMNEQLRSRLSCGLISNIEAPNFNTRVKILQKKSGERGYEIPDEITEYLANELSDNVRQLESGLVGVAARSSLLGAPIDYNLAESVIKNIVNKNKKITVDVIKELVCKEYGISLGEIISRSRKQAIVLPRQVAIYLARRYTDQPLQTIGKNFNRYHATIMHSIGMVEQKLKENNSLKKQVDFICGKLDSGKF